MARKRHKPEEIVAKLRQVEVLTGQGASIAEAVKTIAVRHAGEGFACFARPIRRRDRAAKAYFERDWRMFLSGAVFRDG
ncbi:MAG: hypothetical protein ABSF67_00745 [Roseiarcus sp.]|jgi:hypothetical protein